MEKDPNYSSLQQPQEEEIDLISLSKKIWDGRKVIFRAIAIGTVLGVAIALLSPKQYTATSTIVPQMGSDANSKLGGLGSLAALAGINIDMMSQQNGSDLSPIVYPQIVSSVPFQLELMNTPLNFVDFPQPVTLFDYMINLKRLTFFETIIKYTFGLPNIILKAILGKKDKFFSISNNELKPLSMTEDQVKVQKMLDDMVVLDVKAKDGYLIITVNLSEPVATAQLALKAQNLLQKYIIDFKTQKAEANLDFVEESYNKSKKEFEKAQIKLAIVNDRSKGFTSGLPQVETDRLQSEYTITFGVYQELAKQYEQAKIQVKKETPVFTVVEPPVVPNERTKPKRLIILILWFVLGGVTGVGIVFGKEYWQIIKEKWNET